MKKISLLILLFFILNINIYSQYNNYSNRVVNKTQTTPNRDFDISKLTISGGFGLQFGDYTLINASPQVGYNFSDKINAGLGFTYTYLKNKEYINNNRWTETRSYVGFNVYGRYYPITNLILMIQPDINRMWQTFDTNRPGQEASKSTFVPALLVGGGFRYGPMQALLQYDVVQNEYSPYGNNIFYSVGYTWNF